MTDYPAVQIAWPPNLQVTVQPAMLDGRLRCKAILIESVDGDPDGVTSDLIRTVPVGELVRQAAETLGIGDLAPLPPKDFAKDGLSEQALRDILAVHEWCVRTGRKPLGVLERDYGIPRAKASRWLGKARR